MRMRKLLIIIITPLLISWIDPFRDEISRGNANYHNKKYEESLKNYEKSSDYAPDKKSRASLAFNRGDARFKLGEYDKAVENFRQSLESEDPDVQKKAFLNMGNSYLQMKKYDEAVEAYVNALKIDPGYEKAKKNLEYKPSNIIVSNGAKHSLYNAIMAIVEEGDEVLLPMPYWVSYPELIKLAGGKVVFVPCDEKFVIDLDAMEKLITDKTSTLILNNPSNPTGVVLGKDIIEKLAHICIENNINVISDEIYDQLIYTDKEVPSVASVNGMKDKTIVINGVSKTYSMTGWRIGYLAAPEEVAKAINSMQSQTTSGPNSIAQYASAEALSGGMDAVEEMKKAFRDRKNAAVELIQKIDGLSCIVPEGAFYIMINVSKLYGKKVNGKPIKTSMDFASVLLEESLVAVIPGEAFGAPEYIRISYTASMENILRGLSRIEDFVKKCE